MEAATSLLRVNSSAVAVVPRFPVMRLSFALAVWLLCVVQGIDALVLPQPRATRPCRPIFVYGGGDSEVRESRKPTGLLGYYVPPEIVDAPAKLIPPPERAVAKKKAAAAHVNSSHHVFGKFLATAAVVSAFAFGGLAGADEIGRETEAPTLFTGETVMICKKRGPLGACLETEKRTAENDNDKSKKYFRDPEPMLKQRKEAEIMAKESEGNALIQKLRQQSETNKEKNDLLVRQKTLMNDQSASFGPFDRQVVILNTDGRTFTLLENPQAMRLKKAGFIEDRKFVKQPSREELDAALEPGEGEGFSGLIQGLFGGSSES